EAGRSGDVVRAIAGDRSVCRSGPASAGLNRARRAARRRVARIAGPSTAIATALVTARPRSQPAEVNSTYPTNRPRLSSTDAPGRYDRSVPPPPRNGHDHRLI